MVVDLIGYRKHGHNELDQPSFTQPLLYKVIAKHQSPLTVHTNRLIADGAFTKAEIDKCIAYVDQTLEEAFERSKTYEADPEWSRQKKWEQVPKAFEAAAKTGEDIETLRKVGKALVTFPEGFALHRQIDKIHQAKAEAGTFVCHVH